jgi:hypothetical protein
MSKLTPKRFTLAWQTSSTLDEVCRKLSVSPQQALEVARSLRLFGVRLKPLANGEGQSGEAGELLNQLLSLRGETESLRVQTPD